MTKRHSRFVQALGNGNYLTVTILRLGGAIGIGTILTGVFWIGATSADLAASIKANTEAMKLFVRSQELRDAKQDERMGRQDKRMSDLHQQLQQLVRGLMNR